MRITVDENRCCGAGQCVLAAPDVFDQRDDDGTVVLLDSAPSVEEHPSVQRAVETCPTGAITVTGI